MRRTIRAFLWLATLCALVQISPASSHALLWMPDRLAWIPLPVSARPFTPPSMADLDRDGQLETLKLIRGRLSILSAGALVWQSPPTWEVTGAAITDLDGDSTPEVTLLLWRPFQPWPVDRWLPHGGRIADFHDSDGNSCHIILIVWRKDGYRERWAGSALAEPITAFAAADLDGDGRQELIALESSYAVPRFAPARRLKIWEWNGFGFTALAEVEGRFAGFTLRQFEGDRLLILPYE